MPAGGFIGKAIHDAGKAWEKASAATAQGVKITVNEDNVLKAAGIIAAEAERFKSHVDAIARHLHVKPMGDDLVSKEAARVLNIKFYKGDDSYIGRCLQRVEMLEQLAAQLKEAAKTYQMTEEHIESQFNVALQDAQQAEMPRRGAGGRHVI